MDYEKYAIEDEEEFWEEERDTHRLDEPDSYCGGYLEQAEYSYECRIFKEK